MPFLSLPLNESTSSSVSTSNRTRHGEELSFDQNPEVQAEPLRVLITQRGWSTYRVYSDRASGAKERRPGIDALMADARRGLFDVVIVWRFDRFARSVKQLVTALEEFRSLKSTSFPIRKRSTLARPWARLCSPSSRPWRNWNVPSSGNGSWRGLTMLSATGRNRGSQSGDRG